MTQVKVQTDKVMDGLLPVFVIAFFEEGDEGAVLSTQLYNELPDTDMKVALIDAAVDMLMQKRDQMVVRELN
jgi:hypothetical protein